jgi:hypothetical protein
MVASTNRRYAPSREEAALARLDILARLLDSAVRIPGTNIRFGADAVLNLIPGIGILTSQGLAAYIVIEAHRLKVPFPTLLRMLGHLGLDFAISAVPVVGWVGDVFFRANLRNMALLREHLTRPTGGDRHNDIGLRPGDRIIDGTVNA